MPRKLRLEYAGAIYHVMNRGDRGEAIFLDDADRRLFLQTLDEACTKTDWQVHAFCLMPNHFHFVLETPKANLVAGMKWLLGTYSNRFNRRHRLFGHLFSGRFKSLIVDGSGNGYLKSLCDYVHLNPVRARMLAPGQPLRLFPWSSYGEYLKPPGRRRPSLRVDRLFGEMRIPSDSAPGRRQFELIMEERATCETGFNYHAVRRGWYLGSNEFRRELLTQMEEKVSESHYGGERHEVAAEKAERLVQAHLKRLRWPEEELGRRRKSDPGKVRIARQLRAETTMTLKWIAARLRMGTWTHVSNLLRNHNAKRNEANNVKSKD